MACYKNPNSDYIECVKLAWFWCILFGPFYLAFKGLWKHLFIWIVVTALSKGAGAMLLWVLYPLMVGDILSARYIKDGWIELY